MAAAAPLTTICLWCRHRHRHVYCHLHQPGTSDTFLQLSNSYGRVFTPQHPLLLYVLVVCFVTLVILAPMLANYIELAAHNLTAHEQLNLRLRRHQPDSWRYIALPADPDAASLGGVGSGGASSARRGSEVNIVRRRAWAAAVGDGGATVECSLTAVPTKQPQHQQQHVTTTTTKPRHREREPFKTSDCFGCPSAGWVYDEGVRRNLSRCLCPRLVPFKYRELSSLD